MAGLFSVTGLGSGLDTASMVQQLMAIERRPLTLLQNRQNRVRQIGDALRAINGLLSTLKDKAHALQQNSTIRARAASSSNTTLLTVSASSDAPVTSFTVTIERVATSSTVTSDAATGVSDTGTALGGLTFNTALSGSTGQFTVGAGGKSATIDWDASVDTITTILTKINTADAGVVASYDSTNQRLTLTAKDTGAQTITKTDVSGNLLAAFEIDTATQTTGVTAQYRVNGGLVQSSDSNIVTSAMPGVTLTLLKADAANPVTVTVTPDTETIKRGLEEFITAFNSLVDRIASDTKYDAATKTAGILLGDTTVNFIESRLRTLVMNSLDGLSGTITRLSDIGITTGAVGSATGTTKHLVLDAAKLSSALAANPDAVAELLAGTSSVDGVMERIEDYIAGLVNTGGALANRLTQNDSTISELDKRISELQNRLTKKQEALEKRFAQMEVALVQLQQQALRIGQQLTQLGRR